MKKGDLEVFRLVTLVIVNGIKEGFGQVGAAGYVMSRDVSG